MSETSPAQSSATQAGAPGPAPAQPTLSFDEQLNNEVSQRLAAMEDPGYEFPNRMKKIDWVLAAVLAVAALVITEVATLTAGVM